MTFDEASAAASRTVSVRFFDKHRYIIIQRTVDEIQTTIKKQTAIRVYKKIAQMVPAKIGRILTYNIARDCLKWVGVYSGNKWLLLVIMFILL